MKARIENSKIVIYGKLPSKYRSETLNIAGGFDKLPTEIHEQEGFYDVLIPVYDNEIEKPGDVYFNAIYNSFTYPVISIQFPTLEDAKARKITELKDAVKDLYQSIQWYVEMKRMNDEAIPTVVKDKIKTIKTKYDQLKAQIYALTTVVDVIKFKLPYDQVETLKSQLESFE